MQFSLSPLTSQFIQLGNIKVPVDGIMEVSHNNSFVNPLHPVETGSNISDAQHTMPIETSFTAWITDTPQSIIDKRAFLSLPNITGLQLVESHTKVQLEKIEKSAGKGNLVTVRTKYSLFEEYYLLSFSYTETSTSGLLINFTIRERQDDSDNNRTTANFSSDLGLW